MQNTTEQDSYYQNLEQMPVAELLQHINEEDRTVPEAVAKAITGANCNSSGRSILLKFPLPSLIKQEELSVSAFNSV